MENRRVAGLIVAAGLSSRMHSYKPLLALHGKTVVEMTVDSLRSGGIHDVYAVSGYRAGDIEPLLVRKGVKIVTNRHYAKTDMFESVRLGLKALQEHSDAFFLLPGDMPLVRPHTFRTLCKVHSRETAAVLQPTYRGQCGHPPLIDKSYYDGILAYEGPEGLRGALACFAAGTIKLELPDPGLVMDLDTPDDYAAMCQYAENMQIPSPEICADIWKWFGTPRQVTLHCQAVAAKAKELAQKLAGAGHYLDERLVEAAALLHDVAKGRENHSQCGRAWLEELGYPQVAHVVAVHTDLPEEAVILLDERAVVFLADKLVQHDGAVTSDERFQAALAKYAADPEIVAGILGRRDKARRVEEQIDRLCRNPG